MNKPSRVLHLRLEDTKSCIAVYAYDKGLNEAAIPRGDIPGGITALIAGGLKWRARFGMRGNLTLYRVTLPVDGQVVEALLEAPPELVSFAEHLFSQAR
jgi:hypothetical protein